MSQTLLRLGRRDVDLSAKEIWLEGRLQHLEPKAFDVLAYLLQHRHRVVPKEELARAVWDHMAVSDNALKRAVMKVRQAIDEKGSPELIRTVPRIGYRITPWEEVAPDEEISPVNRCAVLPFENATGEDDKSWVELGLMSLVVEGLRHRGAVDSVSVSSTQAALEGLRASEDIGTQVRTATGADLVVRTRVTRVELRYRAEMHLLSADRTWATSVESGHAALLGQAIVGVLHARLAPDASSPDMPICEDPMATTAFARALEAIARLKWELARKLLDMTLALVATCEEAQLALLQVLSVLGDEEASLPLARDLVSRAEATANLQLAARVNLLLGRMYYGRLALRPAAYRLEAGICLIDERRFPEEAAFAMLQRSHIAGFELDAGATSRLMTRAGKICERTGNRMLQVAYANSEAVLSAKSGDFERASEFAMRAHEIAQKSAVRTGQVIAGANCVDYLSQLGRLDEALAFSEDCLATAVSLGRTTVRCIAAEAIAWIGRVKRDSLTSKRALEYLPSIESLVLPLDRLAALRGLGHHFACTGDQISAAEHYGLAIQDQRAIGNWEHVQSTLPWWLLALVQSGRSCEAASHLDEAHRLNAKYPPVALWPIRYVMAAIAHAQGEAEKSLALLDAMIKEDPPALWKLWGTVDAAWLLAERGCNDEALAVLKLVPERCSDHALVHAAAARIGLNTPDTEAATASYHRYVKSSRLVGASDFFRTLESWYFGTAVTVPPTAPYLPSLL